MPEGLDPALRRDAADTVQRAVSAIGEVLLGKEPQVRLALCCLFSRGHLLIEDLPGMGKTTLAYALAGALGLSCKRIQFTSDLLPADILGVSIYHRQDHSFVFHPGPVFSQVLLADEINRSTPRTQSALLEAMAEGQVTIEGETRPLPQPFFVIATQNPVEQSGTYPLPESQLDRFLMRIELGYPHPRAEREMLLRGVDDHPRPSVPCCVTPEQLAALRRAVEAVHCSDAVLDYLQRLVRRSREGGVFAVGLSPRGAFALLTAARTWAFMAGRDHLLPEDVQEMLPAVAGHRLVPDRAFARDGRALVDELLGQVDVLSP